MESSVVHSALSFLINPVVAAACVGGIFIIVQVIFNLLNAKFDRVARANINIENNKHSKEIKNLELAYAKDIKQLELETSKEIKAMELKNQVRKYFLDEFLALVSNIKEFVLKYLARDFSDDDFNSKDSRLIEYHSLFVLITENTNLNYEDLHSALEDLFNEMKLTKQPHDLTENTLRNCAEYLGEFIRNSSKYLKEYYK